MGDLHEYDYWLGDLFLDVGFSWINGLAISSSTTHIAVEAARGFVLRDAGVFHEPGDELIIRSRQDEAKASNHTGGPGLEISIGVLSLLGKSLRDTYIRSTLLSRGFFFFSFLFAHYHLHQSDILSIGILTVSIAAVKHRYSGLVGSEHVELPPTPFSYSALYIRERVFSFPWFVCYSEVGLPGYEFRRLSNSSRYLVGN